MKWQEIKLENGRGEGRRAGVMGESEAYFDYL
jgi:hypothetical protein